jgi:hemoglobin
MPVSCSRRRALFLFCSTWLALPALGAADAPAPSRAAAPARSLYERIGGEPALKLVVDDFVAAAAADPKVNFTRDGRWQVSDANVQHLKAMLVAFMGQALGGPQRYTGRGMRVVHQGMGITKAEFDALAGHLEATLRKHKVPAAELAEIMKIAASTAPDIIEKP